MNMQFGFHLGVIYRVKCVNYKQFGFGGGGDVYRIECMDKQDPWVPDKVNDYTPHG